MTRVRHAWGSVRLPAQRLVCRSTGKHSQVLFDKSLDASGWTPIALERLLDLAVRLPFGEAAEVARDFGLNVSCAELARLSEPYARACRNQVNRELERQALAPLAPAANDERVMVLQADGVIVLGRPEDGRCPGVEVKSLIAFAQASPSERAMVADVTAAEELLPLAAGLLRVVGARENDQVVLVGDGASWIESLGVSLGIEQVIDVFHACEYLEVVMVAAGWTDAERLKERRSWLRGEVNAREWLAEFLPSEQRRAGWDREAVMAVNYLRSRVSAMDYAIFKTRGWPIGSGQVEGMNKSVVGHRMKRSGMHWSRSGAARMAAWRAQACSRRPLHTHDHLRRHAYPNPPT